MTGGKLKLGGKHKRGERGSLERNRLVNDQTWRPKRASP